MHNMIDARQHESPTPSHFPGTPPAADQSDRHLLEQFTRRRDETAFAVLVQRHGSLVLGVCRRVLKDVHDAEDAFQATFLILVRKAGSIAQPELLANWLYGVAYRTARKARTDAARRRHHERRALSRSMIDRLPEAAWRELRAVLAEELARLPDKYRAPLVLCDAQGLTHEEAAQQLAWPIGSMSARLARGRKMLRERLAGRDLAGLPELLTPRATPRPETPARESNLSTPGRLEKPMMWILINRIGVALFACLVILWLAASPARAQSMGNPRAPSGGQQPAVGIMGGGLGLLGGFGGRIPNLGAIPGGIYGIYGGSGFGVYGGGAGAYGTGVYGGAAGAYGTGVYGGAAGAYGASAYGGAAGAYGGSAYGSYYEDAYGGYLRGNADVIGATGRFLVNQQDARHTHEQVGQARIDTRRKLFDEYLYERSNTPTLEDERERLHTLEVRRSLNDPPVTEIWSAKALNDLLRDAQKLRAQGSSGPTVALDAVVLKRINVAAGRRAGNVGLLKNEGKLTWPPALLSAKLPPRAEDLRQHINALLPDAISQAVNGRVDARVLQELHHSLGALQASLAEAVSRIPPNQYIEARRFLNNLDEGLRALAQPQVGLYFTDKYAAKGRTVPELVEYMTQEGLVFAPAVAGDEAAYVALHRALAAYEVAARGQSRSERGGDKEK
jgi:RNA polymerase sigma factor (sigma-70 family)